jgi:hypothetical protein
VLLGFLGVWGGGRKAVQEAVYEKVINEFFLHFDRKRATWSNLLRNVNFLTSWPLLTLKRTPKQFIWQNASFWHSFRNRSRLFPVCPVSSFVCSEFPKIRAKRQHYHGNSTSSAKKSISAMMKVFMTNLRRLLTRMASNDVRELAG